MDTHESENPKESNEGSSRHSKDSHHGKSRSHWGLSTAVHGVGFVAKKMVNNRVTDSLWSLKRSSNSSSTHDTSSIPNAKKENLSNENLSDQTSKPSLNVADEQTTKSDVSSKPTHERKKKGRDVIDESENSKLRERISHGRQVNRTSTTGQSENLKSSDDSEYLKPPDGSDVSTKSSNEASKHQDASHVRLVNQHRWPSTTSSDVIDHLGASKPANTSHVRPVNQHRWPSTTGSNVIDHSETSKPPATQHLWPSTVGSNVLSKNINLPEEVSKTSITPNRRMLQEFSSDPTTELQPSTPNKSHGLASRGVSPSPALRGASLIPSSKGGRGVSLTPATIKGGSLTPATRGVSLTPATRKVDPQSTNKEMGVDLSQITRGVGPSVATRGFSPTPATRGANLIPPSRGVSPTPFTRPINPVPEYHTPLQPSSPVQSYDSNTFSISKEPNLTPSRGVSPTPSDRQTSPTQSTRGVSPTPSRHSDLAEIGRRVISRARGVSPIPSKPSGSTRHFISSSILSMFTSARKEKIIAERKDASQYLELLQNIQVQWQFLNAGTEAALDHQRITSEKSLFDMWRTILELRDSVAAKKIEITMSILQLKLYAVLYRQMAYMDDWASIQREHESALYVTVNDLVTRSVLLPIIGGVNVKVDIKLLKFIVYSSVEVMQATISSIKSTLAKVGGTRHLASELVNVALHERALLDECEIFLASAAPLQVEECSLRSYLIQMNRTYNSE
ncbi:hypothetical protein Lser_V15G21450 [Lactuca serriola]